MWHLLTASWNFHVESPWLQMALAIASVVCGTIVGSEREKREKPAGLRTLVLVSLGSAIFTMISFAFTTSTGDSGRVAAQIVTGIGFLGAGAILHGSGLVTGMTTAATVWVTAAIGMVVGTGYVGAGVGLSVLVRAILSGIYAWESYKIGRLPLWVVKIVYRDNGGKTRAHIEKVMEDFHVHDLRIEGSCNADAAVRATVNFRLPQHARREFLRELALLPDVLEVHPKESDSGQGP